MSHKKEVCKEYMQRLFGPISAQVIDYMTEDEAVDHCIKKIDGIFGEKLSKEFNKSLQNSNKKDLFKLIT